MDSLQVYYQKCLSYRNGKHDSLFFLAHKLLNASLILGNTHMTSRAYSLLSECYHTKNDFQQALAHSNSAISAALKTYDKAALGNAYFWQGETYYWLSEYEKAEISYKTSLKFAGLAKDTDQLATCYSSLAIMSRDFCDFSAATEYLGKALILTAKSGNMLTYAAANRDVGIISYLRGDTVTGFNNLWTAFRTYQQMGDSSGIAEMMIEFAIYHSGTYRDSSLYYYQKAFNYFSRQKDEIMMMVVKYNLANLYYDGADYSSALPVFLETYKKSEQNGDIGGQTKSLLMIVSVHIKLKRLGQAREYFNMLYGIMKNFHPPALEVECAYEEINFLKAKGDYRKVADAYERYISLKEKMNEPEILARRIALQKELDYEHRINEITELQNRTALQQSNLKNQHIVITSLTVLIFMAVCFICAIIFYYRKNLRYQKRLIESEKSLAIQTEQLKQLNDTKNKFFSIIAHDLRNPFHTIIGISEMLGEQPEEMDTDQSSEMLRIINHSSKQAHHLLENLLLWARTQSNEIIFSPESVNFNELAGDAIQIVHAMALKKEIALVNQLPKVVLTHADKSMIKSVILNLLTNALKYTPQNGVVTLSAQKRETEWEISVTDTGVGVPEERIDSIFNLIKTSTPGTEKEKGSGLGLMLCKEFIEKHKGRIWVESAEGKGSIFYFTIPVEAEKIIS